MRDRVDLRTVPVVVGHGDQYVCLCRVRILAAVLERGQEYATEMGRDLAAIERLTVPVVLRTPLVLPVASTKQRRPSAAWLPTMSMRCSGCGAVARRGIRQLQGTYTRWRWCRAYSSSQDDVGPKRSTYTPLWSLSRTPSPRPASHAPTRSGAAATGRRGRCGRCSTVSSAAPPRRGRAPLARQSGVGERTAERRPRTVCPAPLPPVPPALVEALIEVAGDAQAIAGKPERSIRQSSRCSASTRWNSAHPLAIPVRPGSPAYGRTVP